MKNLEGKMYEERQTLKCLVKGRVFINFTGVSLPKSGRNSLDLPQCSYNKTKISQLEAFTFGSQSHIQKG